MFYLESLLLNNFRNYLQQQVTFHPRLNIIVGENGQGKTNLIESIYYLSVTRSFRTNRDQEMAGFNGSFFGITGRYLKNDLKYELQISYSENQVKVQLDRNSSSRFEYLQFFPTVVFSPDDLMIIREGPATRRRFLNLEASRLNKIYFKELRSYQRVLMQRNKLLKENRSRREMDRLLEPWSDSLISLGCNIIRARVELVQALEVEAAPFFSMMTGERESLKLEYISSFGGAEGLSELEPAFREKLWNQRDLELRRQSTLVGPHLDDFRILINGQDTRKFSSQGQKRTAALALKMAETKLFYQINGSWPIVLLDDVFSELDSRRKEFLLEFLSRNESQCFLTSAVELGLLSSQLRSSHRQYSVHGGVVTDEKDGTGY